MSAAMTPASAAQWHKAMSDGHYFARMARIACDALRGDYRRMARGCFDSARTIRITDRMAREIGLAPPFANPPAPAASPASVPEDAFTAATERLGRMKWNLETVSDARRVCGDLHRELGRLADELRDALTMAEDDAFTAPAPDVPALQWKLAYLRDFATGCRIEARHIDVIRGDVERLVAA